MIEAPDLIRQGIYTPSAEALEYLSRVKSVGDNTELVTMAETGLP